MDNFINSYKLKITPDYDKRIYRVIRIYGTDTLDDLSDVILSSFNFDDEHLYLFNMDNMKYSENCYNSMPEYGEESSDIPIDNLHLAEKQKILYLYDFGDEWVFRIFVQKIDFESNYNKPLVLEAAGEVEQYPDYDDEYEEVISLRLVENLKIIDILNEIEDENIQDEYLSLFDYQRAINGKSAVELRYEIMEEVRTHPEHLMLFFPNKQLEYLDAFVKNENIFSKQDRCELMKMYSYGFCRMNEEEYGFTIEVPRQVIDVYKPYITETKNRKVIEKNMELQKIMEYLLSKYGVIELDNLFKILCFITKRDMEYSDFKFLAMSRFHYMGMYFIFEGDENFQFISLLQQEDALRILELRNSSEKYKMLSYPVFTLQHCQKAIKQNYYKEYSAYEAWWEYLNFDIMLDFNTCNRLLSVTTYAALFQEWEEKNIINECRELFHQGGCNFTRKAQRLIKALLEGLPAAVIKGRTIEEYGKNGMIRDGMYNSIEEAEKDRIQKQVNKSEKVNSKNRDENEKYEQLSLF
ncbi:MAG: plasmid pRiA4b ORF-3 family protein [Lachnospiraceae bacterium]|nr:plasmid pRiA4b ORF-3 family protein [Lachnospiraceae bacterium]